MPIEFHCTRCQKQLRTPDDSGGRQAKCPACGAVVAVPEPRTPETPPSAPRETANPYEAPAIPSDAAPPQIPAPGVIRPTVLCFSDTIGQTWNVFTKTWLMSILAFLVFTAVTTGGLLVVAAPVVIVALTTKAIEFIVPTIVLAAFALGIFMTWLNTGRILFFVKTARGLDPGLGELFAGGPYLWRVIGATILYQLGLAAIVGVCAAPCVLVGVLIDPVGALVGLIVGQFLAIVPAAIFFLTFFPYLYLIVDQNLGILEAFSVSRQVTSGNRLTIFLIILVVALVGSAISSATFPLGVFVVTPFTYLLHAVIYLLLIGHMPYSSRTHLAPRDDTKKR
ncbi:MAG TPA: hypothetical protein VJL29_08075 [Thermoguttaceae bacterium]|nr:hypothetical protein [Thermoguttaceae bacterium]